MLSDIFLIHLPNISPRSNRLITNNRLHHFSKLRVRRLQGRKLVYVCGLNLFGKWRL